MTSRYNLPLPKNRPMSPQRAKSIIAELYKDEIPYFARMHIENLIDLVAEGVKRGIEKEETQKS